MRLVALAVVFIAATARAAPHVTESYLHAGALSGTMLRPVNNGPTILIIPGSGPTDRDGNNPLGISEAQALADKGVTTVRIDKRGMFGSSGAVGDPNAVTVDDYADDVHAWVKVIRQSTGAPCVWVAGHSEGGLVALVASRRRDGFCGIILLASPGRPAGAIVREQLLAILGDGPMFEQASAVIQTFEYGRRPDVVSMHPALQEIFAPPIHGLLISLFSYDPARLIAEFQKPILILQGRRDLQVSVKDAKRLKKAAPDAKLVLLPDSNHIFKRVTSADATANQATYSKPGAPLSPRLAEEVANFILAGHSL